jgi:hypothetical protein
MKSRLHWSGPLVFLALSQCHDMGTVAGPNTKPLPAVASILSAAPVPAPFLYWPLDAAGATATGPYSQATGAALTAIFDHHNAPLIAYMNGSRKGQKWPHYLTGPKSHTSDEKVFAVGDIAAATIDNTPKTIAPCGFSTVNPVQVLRDFDITYDGSCTKGNLAYDNHTGIDIRQPFGLPVYAPADGWVSYSQIGPDRLIASDLHALAVCLTPDCKGWKVRLLHLSSWLDNKGLHRAMNEDGSGEIDCVTGCAQDNAHVTPGQLIGYSGNYYKYSGAPKGWGGVPRHLHLEVLDPDTIPHDPYGWRSAEPDPMGVYTNGPLWLASPGSHNFIAFYSERSGAGDIFLYDASSLSLLPLPGLNTGDREIPGSITPDGRFIAFQRTASGEDVVLYDRSTSSEVPLPGLNSGYDDAAPSITPDGRFIAFVTARSGDANWEDVLLYDRSTSSLVPLPGLNTNGPGGFHEGNPSISADGRYIAFTSNRSGVMDIFLYDRSTSSLVPLPGLNDPAYDHDPSISADGRFIAFFSARGGVERIYLYDRSTSSLVPLPGLDFPAAQPSLSADASYIAFSTGFFSGNNDVFVYDRSKCSLVDLPGLNDPTNHDGYPAIAFSASAPHGSGSC